MKNVDRRRDGVSSLKVRVEDQHAISKLAALRLVSIADLMASCEVRKFFHDLYLAELSKQTAAYTGEVVTAAQRILSGAPSPARRAELAADGCVSVAEAMAFLGIGHTELYRLMGAGAVAWVKVGRRRLVSRRSLTEFLANRMVGG